MTIPRRRRDPQRCGPTGSRPTFQEGYTSGGPGRLGDPGSGISPPDPSRTTGRPRPVTTEQNGPRVVDLCGREDSVASPPLVEAPCAPVEASLYRHSPRDPPKGCRRWKTGVYDSRDLTEKEEKMRDTSRDWTGLGTCAICHQTAVVDRRSFSACPGRRPRWTDPDRLFPPDPPVTLLPRGPGSTRVCEPNRRCPSPTVPSTVTPTRGRTGRLPATGGAGVRVGVRRDPC